MYTVVLILVYTLSNTAPRTAKVDISYELVTARARSSPCVFSRLSPLCARRRVPQLSASSRNEKQLQEELTICKLRDPAPARPRCSTGPHQARSGDSGDGQYLAPCTFDT